MELIEATRNIWNLDVKYGICGSCQELSNEYLIAAIGFDAAENGPFKGWEGKRVLRWGMKSRDD